MPPRRRRLFATTTFTLLASAIACGGGARGPAGTSASPGTAASDTSAAATADPAAPAADPALATLLESSLPLPAEMSTQTDWTVKVTCDSPADPAACTAAFTGPAGSSADPCSAAGGPGLTISFSTDATGAAVRDGLERSWF